MGYLAVAWYQSDLQPPVTAESVTELLRATPFRRGYAPLPRLFLCCRLGFDATSYPRHPHCARAVKRRRAPAS